jgi:hypothetical protein
MRKIKKYITLLIVALSVLQAHAQIQADPAHWAYGLKKLAGNTYEVHLQCTIDTPWHIYAQKQITGFIGTRTRIAFDKTPGLTIAGQPLEKGKKVTYTVQEVGITNYEYAGKVDFVQRVMVKPGIKEIRGTITYQTCTHEHCLTVQTINFTVPVH